MPTMNTTPVLLHQQQTMNSARLALAITRAASTQTYLTIRFLVDRDLAADAYRAYAYFRWVDDVIDAETGSKAEKVAFLDRQQVILEGCYRGQAPSLLSPQEEMLADLIGNDREKDSNLRSYLYNMMAVMVFDAERRGRQLFQSELSLYVRLLSTSVTDALHYFIGHNCAAPCIPARYMAVSGAHVVHMLRDTVEDTAAGYFNIPLEYTRAHGISLQDVDGPAYREWVHNRVQLARRYFQAGREYIAQSKNLRCRLAGYAYTARFEWMLRAIEMDGYHLRAEYPERKSLQAGLWMTCRTLLSLLIPVAARAFPRRLSIQSARGAQ
jgi:phytoene/squalene synthetase